jgi:hypothetical protein
MRPPQRGQANTSTAKVCRISSGHDQFRGAGGGSASTAAVVAASRLATGVDDSGSLCCLPHVITGSRCEARLAPAHRRTMARWRDGRRCHAALDRSVGTDWVGCVPPVGDRRGAPPTVRRQYTMVQDEIDLPTLPNQSRTYGGSIAQCSALPIHHRVTPSTGVVVDAAPPHCPAQQRLRPEAPARPPCAAGALRDLTSAGAL